MLGNLLDPPVIAKEVLFTIIDVLRAELHDPDPLGEENPKSTPQAVTVVPASLGSHSLDLAKLSFKVYETLERNAVQIQRAFGQTERITGLIAESGAGKSYTTEKNRLSS